MADVTFDDALSAVVDAVEKLPLDLTGCEATLLRDLVGRVRVHVAKPVGREWPPKTRELLKQALAEAGPYGTTTVFLDDLGGAGKEFPLADRLVAERTPLDREGPGSANSPAWYRFERRFSKDSWLEETGTDQEPWPLDEGTPVLSFFGFKGGVGRTTALAALALHLADLGKSVAVIDLDLEAPGLTPLLGGEGVPIDLGVVDFLIEERLARGNPLALSRFYLNSPASAVGTVRVFPAGRLDGQYVEKLGRIDVQGLVQPEHAVRRLLLRLLERIRLELRPHAILLDVRAGLHDLGGVSLAGLSHLELIFAVNSSQSWAGLPVVLGHLGRLRAGWVKLVHTMVPPSTRGGDEVHQDFVARAYDLCSEHYYLSGAIPGPEDRVATHWAYRLPFREALMGLSDLSLSRSELLSDEHRLFCEQVARDAGLDDSGS